MGFRIGRSTDAPELETKRTARYGEQKVVATETPVPRDETADLSQFSHFSPDENDEKSEKSDKAMETPVEPQEEAVEDPAEEVNGLTADLVTVDESPVSPVAVVEKKPAKAKRGRKPKK